MKEEFDRGRWFFVSNAGPSNVPFIYLSLRRSVEKVTRMC